MPTPTPCRIARAILILALTLEGLGETVDVEVEWSRYMQCGACVAFATEVEHWEAESHRQVGGTFKLVGERVEWVVERALKTASEGYAYVVHNKESNTQSRGTFIRISVLRSLNRESPHILSALSDLEADPIPSLFSFLTEIAWHFDDDLTTLIAASSPLSDIYTTLCEDTAICYQTPTEEL